MIPEISAAFSSVAALGKIAGALHGVSKQAEINQHVIDLQSSIIDLQGKIFAIQAEYDKLANVKAETEKKLMDYESWEREKERYRFTAIATGISVNVYQPEEGDSAPPHWLCPYCFEKRRKSVLNRPGTDVINYVCHECKWEVIPEDRTFFA